MEKFVLKFKKGVMVEENILERKPSKAFEKYVDSIFVIENKLMRYVKRTKSSDSITYDWSLEEYDDEKILVAGMCKDLATKLQKIYNFEKTKKITLRWF